MQVMMGYGNGSRQTGPLAVISGVTKMKTSSHSTVAARLRRLKPLAGSP